jgi:hypothetical protein
MKFAITSDHYQYFKDNHILVAEDIFTPEQMNLIREGVQAGLSSRGKSDLFAAGRDLHAAHDGLARLLGQKKLAALFAELCGCRTIRLGFDQYLPALKNNEKYTNFLNKENSIRSFSSIQGVIGGLIICLEAPDHIDEGSFLPSKPGASLLCKPDKKLPLSFLGTQKKGAYLLVTYTEETALYFRNEQDPHMHAMRDMGYSLGDRLREPYYPIIFRT